MPSPKEIERRLAQLAITDIMHRARIFGLRYTGLQEGIKSICKPGSYGVTLSHFPDSFSHYGELIVISRASYGHNLYLNRK